MEISLIAPSGQTIILHNRNGASANDIKTVYNSLNNANLAALIGTPIQGDWQLIIRDLAPQDVGQLNSWGLNLDFVATTERLIEKTDVAGVSIPDNSSEGIEQTLSITESGKIKEIEIDVDITHTYIGDLEVVLISPQNDQFVLHNQTGGSRDNLIRTFSMVDTAVLSDLAGQAVTGNWKLRVVDNAARDIGKLNVWGLRFLVE